MESGFLEMTKTLVLLLDQGQDLGVDWAEVLNIFFIDETCVNIMLI